jgi:hypothetical protein
MSLFAPEERKDRRHLRFTLRQNLIPGTMSWEDVEAQAQDWERVLLAIQYLDWEFPFPEMEAGIQKNAESHANAWLLIASAVLSFTMILAHFLA